MTVLRIVSNLEAADPPALARFYADLFDLTVAMDFGWIVTLVGEGAAEEKAPLQISVASEGGSGTPVPHLSIEVDDLDAVLARATAAGVAIDYGPVDEPWGVRRFYLRDPAGRLINVLCHP